MTFLAILAVAATAPGAAAERADWYDCLDRYAQVAVLGSRSAPTLARDALAACSDKRKTLQLQLRRARAVGSQGPDAPAFTVALADEDRDAVMRVIAFVNRHRRQR